MTKSKGRATATGWKFAKCWETDSRAKSSLSQSAAKPEAHKFNPISAVPRFLGNGAFVNIVLHSRKLIMNSVGILRATLFIVSLASCRSLIAQEVTTPPPAPVTTVNLSLMVTDHEKHSRDDVTKEEVQVFEDGIAQTISTITKEEKPVNYVIAIDTSGSFRSLLPGILTGAGLLLEGNKANDETMLIRFISNDKIEPVEKFTADKSKLLEDLKYFKIEMGQSAVIDAIYVAVQAAAEHKSSDPSIRRAVVLFSDGEDRASFYTTDQLIQLLKARNVQVFVVGVVAQLDGERGLMRPSPKEKAEKLLNRVALETGA